MQEILDDLQSDLTDELEKVSLERLSAIDPDLLARIKSTAEESLKNGGSSSRSGGVSAESEESDELSFLVETRSPETIEYSKAWEKLDLKMMKDTHDVIHGLQHLVMTGSSTETRYTQAEAIEMTGALAVAATTATLLTNALQSFKEEEDKNAKSDPLSGSSSSSRGFVSVDKKLFTTKGIRFKNPAVVGVLYEVGLPFVSSSDGRRFATQLELSKHLDALFKKG